MPLDMTGSARYDREPHYRRYLDRSGKVAVICVQDFDYYDYDASRFLDTRTFSTSAEAVVAPIELTEMIIKASDEESASQALRNIRAIFAWNNSGREAWAIS